MDFLLSRIPDSVMSELCGHLPDPFPPLCECLNNDSVEECLQGVVHDQLVPEWASQCMMDKVAYLAEKAGIYAIAAVVPNTSETRLIAKMAGGPAPGGCAADDMTCIGTYVAEQLGDKAQECLATCHEPVVTINVPGVTGISCAPGKVCIPAAGNQMVTTRTQGIIEQAALAGVRATRNQVQDIVVEADKAFNTAWVTLSARGAAALSSAKNEQAFRQALAPIVVESAAALGAAVTEVASVGDALHGAQQRIQTIIGAPGAVGLALSLANTATFINDLQGEWERQHAVLSNLTFKSKADYTKYILIGVGVLGLGLLLKKKRRVVDSATTTATK